MPELVEVETARRILAPQLNGCTIEDVEIRRKSIKRSRVQKLVLIVGLTPCCVANS